MTAEVASQLLATSAVLLYSASHRAASVAAIAD
jgi:hypothetical protein